MTEDRITTPAIHPIDGVAWWQLCYVCRRVVDLKKDPRAVTWLRVGDRIRHRKCLPGSPQR